MTDAVSEGTLLWQPSSAEQKASRIADYLSFLARTRGLDFADYAQLYNWSVDELGEFWASIAEYFQVKFETSAAPGPTGALPRAHWFECATLNYAEQALARRDQRVALVARNESGERRTWTRAELAEDVARARAGLRRLGVGRGDRVAGLLPNGGEAVIAFLATVSLGAIWSSCAPEFGVSSVLERFRQIEPVVLFTVTRYRYGGKLFERGAEVRRIIADLPSLRGIVSVAADPSELPNATPFEALLAEYEPLSFEPVPFEHP
ncbi:MAG TPA: AMP-binding protein, partial [Polyangiaceae bacterium]|nr:AMP-binding protein [Polyangiaceae bacterium]